MKVEELAGVLRTLAQDRYEENAWSQLYRGLRPYVYALAFRAVKGSRTAADEVTQEVFVRLALYYRFEIHHDPDRFRAYLQAMTRNAAASLLRAARVRSDQFEPLGSGYASPRDADSAEDVDAERTTFDAVKRLLSPLDQELLNAILAGRTVLEIARDAGRAPATIRVAMFRLRVRLRKLLSSKQLLDK